MRSIKLLALGLSIGLVGLLAMSHAQDQQTNNKQDQQTDNKDVSKNPPDSTQDGEKKKEPRLKGGFRGHAAEPGAATPPPSEPPPSDSTGAARAVRPKEEQPKEKTKPLVINNEMVKSKESAPTPAGKKPVPTPAAPLPTASYSALSETSKPTDLEGHDEEYWREKARAARERVAKSKESLQQIEAEEHKLENDFYAWDDGQYRDNVIKPAWDRARDALAAAQTETVAAEEAEKNLAEEARKAGALPGWIRE